MSITEPERPVRLRPRRPRRTDDNASVWPTALRRVLALLQNTGKQGLARQSKRNGRNAARGARDFTQRCAVRVSYSQNRIRGQWAAHARYVARESATDPGGDGNHGFNAESDAVDLVETAAGWQSAGDPRMFKVILSPEFGEHLDLKALTRELVRRMERDLGLSLEWAAAAHFNTEHPHVHMLLRGIADGKEVRLAPQYVRSGIRKHAEDLCTVQLGYRTEADRAEARAREVDQPRFTSLDFALQRQRGGSQADSENADHFAVDVAGADELVEQRLHVLRSMGLAKPVGRGRWEVRADFDAALRSMKRAADRQKMLASCSALISDDRLPMEVTPTSRITHLEGRVVGHVLDDVTGRTHMVLEGTDAKIHLIPHDAAVETARQKRLLQPNSFVELSSAAGQRSRLMVRDLGSAEEYLASDRLASRADNLLPGGVVPPDAGWGGWLGRYEQALRGAAAANSKSSGRRKPSRPQDPTGRG